MKILMKILLFFLITINANILLANPRLDEFLREKGEYIYSSEKFDRFEAKTYLTGLTHGIEWMNNELRKKYGDKGRLWCPPDNIALNTKNYLGILKKIYTREPQMGEFPIGLILVMYIGEFFPCH